MTLVNLATSHQGSNRKSSSSAGQKLGERSAEGSRRRGAGIKRG